MTYQSEEQKPLPEDADVGKSNIIEINGRRYDAHTGDVLSGGGIGVVQPAQETATAQPVKPHVVKPIALQQGDVAEATPTNSAQTTVSGPKPRVHDAIRQAAKPKPSHKQQPSKTLMRSAVKKPAPGLKRRVKALGSTDALAIKPAAHIKTKSSVHHLDDRRLRHAQNTPKSQAVVRFGKSRGVSSAPPTHVPVPGPKPHNVPARAPIAQHSVPAHKTEPKQLSPTADLLERALQQATSHEQPRPAAKRRRGINRALSFGVITSALVILGGFVALQNINSVKLHVASAKAGFTASLPDYQPAGYRLSHLNYAPGTVSMKYFGNGDRSYAITEKASGWNSDALRDTFLASSGETYHTVESGGRTLFLYGQNAATWVSNGVWYQVQGNGALSENELVQLAGSM